MNSIQILIQNMAVYVLLVSRIKTDSFTDFKLLLLVKVKAYLTV